MGTEGNPVFYSITSERYVKNTKHQQNTSQGDKIDNLGTQENIEISGEHNVGLINYNAMKCTTHTWPLRNKM